MRTTLFCTLSLILLVVSACQGYRRGADSSWSYVGDGLTISSRGAGAGQVVTATWSEGDTETVVHVNGEVQVSADGRDLLGLDPEGSLTVKERSWSGFRELRVEPGTGGILQYALQVDHEPAAYDASAQAWLGEVMGFLTTRSPLGAESRARAILAQEGPAGLLQSIDGLESGIAQESYFAVLLERPNLQPAVLAQAAHKAAAKVSSNSTLGDILMAIGEQQPTDETLTLALADAANEISSSSTHGEVLESLARTRRLTPTTAQALIRSASGISSSSTQQEALGAVLAAAPSDPSTVDAYVSAAEAISSSSSQGEALQAVVKKEGVATESYTRVVQGVDAISSSSVQEEVLLAVLERAPADPALYSACLDVVKEISSSSSQEAVMEALLARPNLDRATLDKAALTVASISSTSTRERLQAQIIQQLLNTP